MLRGLYTGKILAPNLISQTIMALLSRTSLIQIHGHNMDVALLSAGGGGVVSPFKVGVQQVLGPIFEVFVHFRSHF